MHQTRSPIPAVASLALALPALAPALFVPVRTALRARFGDVIDQLPPRMGAEDFALFSDAVPGFRFHIGSGQPGRSDRVHAPDYQPDEGSIRLGVEACCGILLELLARA